MKNGKSRNSISAVGHWDTEEFCRRARFAIAEGIFEFFEADALVKEWIEIQPAALSRRSSAPTCRTCGGRKFLYGGAFENHVVHQIERHAFGRNSKKRSAAARAQCFDPC